MTRCPFCFVPATSTHIAWMCSSGRCDPQPDARATRLQGVPVASSPIMTNGRAPNARRNHHAPQVQECDRCHGPTAEICPNCHYRYPAGWRGSRATCVAMAGARATGKSIFIGVLIKQVEQLGEGLGTTMRPATAYTDTTYRTQYERPLYEERGIMAPTPAVGTENCYQREPLIFSLDARDGSRHFLVIRDVAGEDLESGSPDLHHLGFFAQSDAVIFLFDPLRVEDITQQLEGLVPRPAVLGGDPRTVLDNTLRLIGAGTPKLAVVLSKFDAMQALRSVERTAWGRIMQNPGAAFFRDPGWATAYDEQDGELLHEEVRSLLQKLDATALVATVERAAAGRPFPYRYFAVSALGDSPNGKVLHSGGIAPFRCLDPLRWVFAQTGVL